MCADGEAHCFSIPSPNHDHEPCAYRTLGDVTIHLLSNCVVMCLRDDWPCKREVDRWSGFLACRFAAMDEKSLHFFVRLPSVSLEYDAVEYVRSDGLNVSRDTNDHENLGYGSDGLEGLSAQIATPNMETG